jgi:cell division protein FtsB
MQAVMLFSEPEAETRGGQLKRFGLGLVWAISLAALGYMGWSLLFSDRGYVVYQQEAQELEQLKSEIASLKNDREHLAREILRFRNDPDALEQLVHEELGYVHGDEFMLVIPEEKGGEEQKVGSHE